ncbi:hypothetical protein HQ325_16745 [Rhodococcus sp. BP-349]|uniref:hypothetical protein n=1 Tax=unclassified Rhodococcus (in: high G+C Gram-positive bacteria) TaxID=192944 RepID=UPI001C9B8732|nr:MULTISPECIES: hypothetical protein [unclassified Rhodococcus (in: high G+C Gram-positive bacteria)]MBY6540324.1 hypothetical protein [Rhodococcus sp. BP-363]MBY6545651.1 hypothetical protein [Rhodococcus sp. BP-369]MBY6564881.1 hypothetical protein [Rhodococcus sp. BP-370]MBY6578183.1 hypothetical protein [Rhodococcus sp. BP-364]MBY6587484.1 hypothetical protein [Rhodococcus sp. BP-358]
MTVNRLGRPHRRGEFVAPVSVLIDAIAHRDRWTIARLATGELLDEALGGTYNDAFGRSGQDAESVRLDGAPVVMVDDGMAVVIGAATGTNLSEPVPVCALLVESRTPGRGWLVAALTLD